MKTTYLMYMGQDVLHLVLSDKNSGILSESVNAPSYTILHPRMDHYIIGDHRSAFEQLTEDEESPKSCQGHKNVLKTLQEYKK